MKLSEWARLNGVSYRTAHRLFKSGNFPCKTKQLATGTILVDLESSNKDEFSVALYARVSSYDQKEDANRQLDRIRSFAASKGFRVLAEEIEIGSGLNGSRKGLISLLKRKDLDGIVVEHRDRLSRFGVDYIEAALSCSGKSILVLNETEFKMDLVQDFIDVVTSMCSRIYGIRSAKNRAKRAVEAASVED